RDALVLTEHVADLALPHPDIAGRNIRILSDMPVELRHVGLAEAHDLHLGAAFRIEIRPALGPADRHPRQRVLEGLLEAEELDDAQVDARVEPQAALVGAERRIECDAETAIDLHLAAVVRPRNAENDL